MNDDAEKKEKMLKLTVNDNRLLWQDQSEWMEVWLRISSQEKEWFHWLVKHRNLKSKKASIFGFERDVGLKHLLMFVRMSTSYGASQTNKASHSSTNLCKNERSLKKNRWRKTSSRFFCFLADSKMTEEKSKRKTIEHISAIFSFSSLLFLLTKTSSSFC